jgi:TP901 family phage tail tape measure protein
VALRDSGGQFRDLDDVFVELSAKWDGLDKNTQRYIATIAAGSRQQSRFIAMMSDYSRTQELITAANNSAGASNEQFEKTLDSLSAKLNQLKNAWDTFTMDILDSDMLKGAVQFLTIILDTINNITEKLGNIGGHDLSGGLKIAALAGSFVMADKAITVFKKSIGENRTILQSFGDIGKSAIQSIKDRIDGMTSSFEAAKARVSEMQTIMD